MEVTKDDYFNVKFNEKKNLLEVKNTKRKMTRKNKLVIGVFTATGALIMINILLIYKFFSILFTL